MNTGTLLSTLSHRVIASAVSGETTVYAGLLLEDSDYLEFVNGADTIEQVVEWVSENY